MQKTKNTACVSALKKIFPPKHLQKQNLRRQHPQQKPQNPQKQKSKVRYFKRSNEHPLLPAKNNPDTVSNNQENTDLTEYKTLWDSSRENGRSLEKVLDGKRNGLFTKKCHDIEKEIKTWEIYRNMQ